MKRPLLYGAGGLAVGVWLVEQKAMVGFLVFCSLLFFTAWKRKQQFFLLTGFLLLGFFRGTYVEQSLAPESIWVEQENTFQGVISKKEESATSVKYWIKNCSLVSAVSKNPCSFPILVYGKENEFLPGDVVLVTGTCTLPEDAKNPGGYSSKYNLWSQNCGLSCYAQYIKELSPGGGSLSRFLCLIRERLKASIRENANETTAGVLCAMLLGDESLLTQETRGWFQSGGISHILAISGLHLSFLGLGLYKILRKCSLSAPLASCISLTFLLLFVSMTGGHSSSFRAFLMSGFFFLSLCLGAPYDLGSSAGAAVLILLWFRPFSLFTSGFLLSFSAVLGIGLLQFLKQGFFRVQLGILPGLLSYYGFYATYSILVNTVVLPMSSLLLPLGIAGALLGLFSPFLGKLLFLIPEGFVWWMEWMGQQSEKLPFARLSAPAPSFLRLFLYLLFLWWCERQWEKRKEKDPLSKITGKERKRAFLWTFLAFLILLVPLPKCTGTVIMLDVSQGDGMLLQTKPGRGIIIDCGSSQEKKVWEYDLKGVLQYQGITTLEGVLLTHGDADHVNGVEQLLDDPKAPQIRWIGLPIRENPQESFGKILEKAAKKNIPIYYLQRGDTITYGSFFLEVLYPKKGEIREENEASLTMKVSYGNFQMLTTGDLEGKGEEEMISLGLPKNVQVLKVAHHGSNGSTSKEFLKDLHPKVALISVGENNTYGHPAPALLERLREEDCEIFETRDSGALLLTITPYGFGLKEYKTKEIHWYSLP